MRPSSDRRKPTHCSQSYVLRSDHGIKMGRRFARWGASMGLIRLGNKPPLTVAPEDTVLWAARAMTERHVGAATVLEGTGVIGVVTEGDVLEKVVAAGGDPNTTRVRDIMTSPALSVS